MDESRSGMLLETRRYQFSSDGSRMLLYYQGWQRWMNLDHGRSRNWTSLSWKRWMNLDRGCSRNRMSLRWQRPADRMQLGMDVILVWAWMLRSSDALGPGRYYGLGVDALVIGCLGQRIWASSRAPDKPVAKGLAAQLHNRIKLAAVEAPRTGCSRNLGTASCRVGSSGCSSQQMWL